MTDGVITTKSSAINAPCPSPACGRGQGEGVVPKGSNLMSTWQAERVMSIRKHTVQYHVEWRRGRDGSSPPGELRRQGVLRGWWPRRRRANPWGFESFIWLAMNRDSLRESLVHGGEGGIRTPVTVTRKADFESAAFDHSATSPRGEPCRAKGPREVNRFDILWILASQDKPNGAHKWLRILRFHPFREIRAKARG